MENERPNKQVERDAEAYLAQASDRYFFDTSSGLHKPKRYVGTDEYYKSCNPKVHVYPSILIETPPKRFNLSKAVSAFFSYALSVVTVLLLFITARFTGNQWQESRRSADASIVAVRVAEQSRIEAKAASDINTKSAKESLTATVNASNASVEASQASNRAYVNATLGTSPLEMCIKLNKMEQNHYCKTLSFRNFGQTPAVNVSVFAVLQIGNDEGHIPSSIPHAPV